jgi:hypothetical protein
MLFGLPADAQQPQLPTQQAAKPANIDRNGVLMLVRSSLLALDQANKTGNYTVLRDIGAPGFQINTAARLAEIFVKLRNDKVESVRRRGDRPTALSAAADRGQRHDADGGFLPVGAVAGQFRPDLCAGRRTMALIRHFGVDQLERAGCARAAAKLAYQTGFDRSKAAGATEAEAARR